MTSSGGRRSFSLGLAAAVAGPAAAAPVTGGGANPPGFVRPGDAAWPDDALWAGLSRAVGGRLLRLAPATGEAPPASPFAIRDDPRWTQCAGWSGGWTAQPSAYAVAAENASDVAAAIGFARRHRLRLVVKGGGHSYLGASSAPGSLLIWMRRLNRAEVLPAFVPAGSTGSAVPAVRLGGGTIWLEAYSAVTTGAGRYVQGGGCTTVGAAGLIQAGGFGSFSKRYGLACASLLEAEVVVADGRILTVNAGQHPDLFRALKGGGGGSFGVVTALVLRTHDLPAHFGAVIATIEARSDDAYRALIRRFLDFYADRLHGDVWGEQVVCRPGRRLSIRMVFQGLSQAEAASAWEPFFGAVRREPGIALAEAPTILAVPARGFWDARVLRQIPGLIVEDDRPGAAAGMFSWAGDAAQAGRVIHAYASRWLPAALLAGDRRAVLADALVDAARHWPVELHFNKGLAGASPAILAEARETSLNPKAFDAFALAIAASMGPPGGGVDVARRAAAVGDAMRPLQAAAPDGGSYLPESDYFAGDWAEAGWGGNRATLEDVKRVYDPDGLFTVHHGIGSADGRRHLQ